MPLANAAAENVLGTIGAGSFTLLALISLYRTYLFGSTVCWSIQLVPQGIFLGAYVIIRGINIPLLVQPQCFCALSAVAFSQCLIYGRGWTTRKAVLCAVGACVLAGGLEAALVFGAKAAEAQGHTQATTTWGVISAIFITGGLLPQYWEIYQYKAVIGVSLVFLSVDLMGGVFSVLSLVFAVGPFDTLASVSYGAIVILEIGVFILAAILNPGHRKRVAAQLKLDEEALADDGNGTRASSPVNGVKSRTTGEAGDDLEIYSSETVSSTQSRNGEKQPEKKGRVVDEKQHAKKEEGIMGWMDPAVTVEEERKELERRTSDAPVRTP